jgi:peptide deformylase
MTDSLDFQLTLYPDPVLRKVAEPVAVFDAELERIVEGMFARMQAAKGRGRVGLRR